MLTSKGIETDAAISRSGTPRSGLFSADLTIPDPVPSQFFFRHPDGNRYLVVDAS